MHRDFSQVRRINTNICLEIRNKRGTFTYRDRIRWYTSQYTVDVVVEGEIGKVCQHFNASNVANLHCVKEGLNTVGSARFKIPAVRSIL